MNDLIKQSIFIYFIFWIYNYSMLVYPIKKQVDAFRAGGLAMGQKWKHYITYPLTCPICFSFYISIIYGVIGNYGIYNTLFNAAIVAIINLFIYLVFRVLSLASNKTHVSSK